MGRGRLLNFSTTPVSDIFKLDGVFALIIPGGKAPPWPSSPSSTICFQLCVSLFNWESRFGGLVQDLFSWRTKLPVRQFFPLLKKLHIV